MRLYAAACGPEVTAARCEDRFEIGERAVDDGLVDQRPQPLGWLPLWRGRRQEDEVDPVGDRQRGRLVSALQPDPARPRPAPGDAARPGAGGAPARRTGAAAVPAVAHGEDDAHGRRAGADRGAGGARVAHQVLDRPESVSVDNDNLTLAVTECNRELSGSGAGSWLCMRIRCLARKDEPYSTPGSPLTPLVHAGGQSPNPMMAAMLRIGAHPKRRRGRDPPLVGHYRAILRFCATTPS